jgi:hypothetical protein
MIGDWQDEWDLKRRGSDQSVNRRDTCRVAAYLNQLVEDVSANPLHSFAAHLTGALGRISERGAE